LSSLNCKNARHRRRHGFLKEEGKATNEKCEKGKRKETGGQIPKGEAGKNLSTTPLFFKKKICIEQRAATGNKWVTGL